MICAAIKGNLDLLKSLHQKADFAPMTKHEIEILWSHMLLCAASCEKKKKSYLIRWAWEHSLSTQREDLIDIILTLLHWDMLPLKARLTQFSFG